MTEKNWTNLHKNYSKEDWIHKPSIFAEQAIEYFPEHGSLLELGAGHGQDGLYFAAHGFTVTSTDLEIASLEANIENASEDIKEHISAKKVDLRKPLSFDQSFDVVYAHLSLHYFDEQTTKRIFEDIYSILKPNGILAFFTNSVDDPEYGTGIKLEEHYFEVDGVAKRYLNVDEAKRFAFKFKPLLIDNNGETYKDAAKGIHHLIRFIGQKVNE
ncbi:MAG TPA: class I SAM-dependent methyltransferase [Candidatus Saccharimonadales bacterium]|nr:class I SAM-dependent methyltransferase [Candidatus Saccharimonadales bacterium]